MARTCASRSSRHGKQLSRGVTMPNRSTLHRSTHPQALPRAGLRLALSTAGDGLALLGTIALILVLAIGADSLIYFVV